MSGARCVVTVQTELGRLLGLLAPARGVGWTGTLSRWPSEAGGRRGQRQRQRAEDPSQRRRAIEMEAVGAVLIGDGRGGFVCDRHKATTTRQPWDSQRPGAMRENPTAR